MSVTKLKIGKYSARDLVSKFGSPLYVYEEDIITQRFQSIASHFKYNPFQIHYAVMANNRLHILRILKKLGAHLQVNSPTELRDAFAAGFDASLITVTTTNISDADLLLYASKGLLINFDSKEELVRYCGLVKDIKIKNREIGIRYQIKWSAPGGTTNALREKKRVGISKKDISGLVEMCRKANLTVTSIHGYVASNMLALSPFVRLARELAGVAKLLPDLKSINYGGGFGLKMQPKDADFDFQTLAQHLSKLTLGLSKSFGRQINLKIEPGRTLLGEAGILLCSVTNIKRLDGWSQIGCDAGFGVLARPLLYGWGKQGYHPIVLADGKGGKSTKYTICSNSALQIDFLGEDRILPEVHLGDLLAVLNVGAYGAVMASGFPGKNLPREILIPTKGQPRMVS